MIIDCINCNKKFDVNSEDIPETGRLLLCSSCNHTWFFKKEVLNKPFKTTKIDEPVSVLVASDDESRPLKGKNQENIDFLDNNINNDSSLENILIKEKDQKTKTTNKNYNILNLTIIFIISFIAVIIILDTFKVPISKIVPDIELKLYNLYETIYDVKLFLTDLI